MAIAEELADSRQAITRVFRSPSLRRLNLALVGSVIGDWAFAVALSVYAFRSGGATALGVISVVRYLTMALLAPFMATLADRYDRRRVMVASDVVRVLLVAAAAAIVIADGPAVPVYALSIVVGVVGLVFRPAQAAILPSLASSPTELTAANVASSTINSVGFFVGPAVAGLLLAIADIGVVFAFDAVTFAWSAVMVFGVRSVDPRSASIDATDGVSDELEPSADAGGMLAGTGDGFRALLGDRDLRLIVVLYVAQTIVAGCSAVYEVTIALDLLELQESGVGVLNAALGIGGLVGGVVALVLSQRGRLSRDYGVGVSMWALPLLLVAAVPSLPSALAAMFLVGIGNSLVDVNAETIVQRLAPDEVLGRVFGALDSLAIAGMALGAAIMPVLIATVGLRAGLAVIAVGVTSIVLVSIRGLARIDHTTLAPVGVETLRAVPMLSVLPEHAIERLARTSERLVVPAGQSVFDEGDDGDRFYIVEAGDAAIARQGQPVAHVGPGGYFGEIALLRDVPRTASVVAVSDLAVRAIERQHFLAAVTGHADSSEQADLVVGLRLNVL